MAVSPDNFSACIAHCKSVKVQYGRLFGLVPQQFSIRRDGSEIFFLAPEVMIGNSLYAVTVADEDQGQHPWEKVLSPSAPRQLTRSEQLLRERMRASGSGITYYEYIDTLDSIIVNSGSGCCLFPCRPRDESQVPNVITYPSLVGALDYKLCPCDKNVLGCVCDGNIWILTSYYDNPIQLTNAKGQYPLRKVMAGQSSFILQEEFDRYTGYWWDPTTERQDKTYRILYEEVDETDVEILRTFNPSKQEIEEYSYPRPGGKNAISTLKLLEFNLESEQPSTQVLSLAPSVASYLSQWEYMTRLGWTPDGNYIWVQVVTREQQLMSLVLISKEAFIKEGENKPVPAPVLLWKETSPSWINIKNTSYFKFLLSPDNRSLKLFIVSEQSSFPHIVFLQGDLPLPSAASTPTAEAVPANLIAQTVTLGEWNVLESKVWVDVDRSIVYFEGNKSSCLDRHLYAVNLTGELPSTDPIQLTPNGFYHKVEINVEKNIFVSSYSGQGTPPAVAVYSISHDPLQTQLLFHIWTPLELPIDFTPPTNFTTQASTGETLHGIVYPPHHLEEGRQYPTILYVYGGPEFQVVKNEFSRFMIKLAQWIHAGFAVVMLDNRGSFNRGCKFESYIKYHMGNVEVEDQVAGLQAAAQAVPYLDLTRAAIVGWSYGGYMALLSIAKKPDVFKLAVAGAPVTDLLWYDTGYTERYLGVPPLSLPAYKRSSVLPLVPNFPNEPGRVLIIHGMNDENVLYTHTSLLLDALILHGKPYSVQLFTGERHGIRNPASSNHCDATVLAYFLKYL